MQNNSNVERILKPYGLLLFLVMLSGFNFSCAPVKFARSNTIMVDPNVNPNSTEVICYPRINNTSATFTYTSGGTLPFIESNCNRKDLSYKWLVKRANGGEVAATIPGLEPVMNPKDIDFRGQGEGAYYVFLEATPEGQAPSPFFLKTPLEFIVPGPGTGNGLVCDPKLNGTFTSVVINSDDPNPTVKANCSPQAAQYIWTVVRAGQTTPIAIGGLSSELQTPDFKSLGEGEYRITLYATTPGSASWQSQSPLVVTIRGAVVPVNSVACTPRINGSMTDLTLTSTSPKPLITANCLPTDVQYTWNVTRGGGTVPMPDLVGATSNPNFNGQVNGTYLIYLTASKNGYNSYSTSQPLVITVNNQGPAMAISCSPRLNNVSTAITMTPTSPNPTVKANCQPPGVTHTWRVTRGGQTVTVPDLNGAESIPKFATMTAGTYLIYLTATLNGYNSFVAASPLEVTVAPAMAPTRKVNLTKLVEVSNNKVDIVMVIDDSKSMLPDNQRLSQRMNEFVTDLSANLIDWQVCAIVTRPTNEGGTMYWAASRVWTGATGPDSWVLKPPATVETNQRFIDTILNIGAGWAGSDDERGIFAAQAHIKMAQYNKCYRSDASLAVILISDEDERSTGGNDSISVYESERGKPLEPEDLPENYIHLVKQTFGESKRFTVNSIIVKPGDNECLAAQDIEVDGTGVRSKAYFGFKYEQLSKATGGGIASICDQNYKAHLNVFKNQVISSLASIPLECAPVGPIEVNIVPTLVNVTAAVRPNSNVLVFSQEIPAGRTISLEYYCVMN